jgi:putative membrane protein
MLRVALSALHLLALAVGLQAVLQRAQWLTKPLTVDVVKRVLHADTEWGLAAFLWIGTGLWRYLGSSEKSSDYYEHNAFFLAKMAILVVVLLLEIKPMTTLIRWRIALGRGTAPAQLPGIAAVRSLSRVSAIQGILVVLMVLLAVAMARGYDL